MDKPLVLFDSECILCNKTVQLLLKLDRKKVLVFSSLSSEIGLEISEKVGVDTNSVLYYSRGDISTKSDAFLRIVRDLGFPYHLMGAFYVVPKFIRNWAYDVVARNRLHWFGKTEHCLINATHFSDRIIL